MHWRKEYDGSAIWGLPLGWRDLLNMHLITQLQLNAILLALLWMFNAGAEGMHH